MTITCSICGRGFKSLLIDSEGAIIEVSQGFVQHLAKSHQITVAAVSRDINILLRLATWFVSMQLAQVGEDERQFHEAYEKQGRQMLRLLGLSHEKIEDNEELEAVGLKHRVRKGDDVAGVKTPGPQGIQ